MTAPLLALALIASRTRPPAAPKPPSWLGAELPLPLAVRTPEDLAFKALAERQYLIFNLLSAGKLAWDAGDYATAADRWEALLRLPELPADIAQGVKPFADAARKRAGGASPAPVAVEPTPPAAPQQPEEKPAPRREAPREVVVRGKVSGGGALGPGGTVVWLERLDGPTPRPRPAQGKVVLQRNKTFIPRVLAVPLGTTVLFRNQDDLFHNVFSLSKPNAFDLGLYKQGNARTQTFDAAGPVQLLCNIHAQMIGWVYVVKSPWYAESDGSGNFSIRGVPPGRYTLHAWNESSTHELAEPLQVGPDMSDVALTVAGDATPPAFVPDKYGKPRQVQLGY